MAAPAEPEPSKPIPPTVDQHHGRQQQRQRRREGQTQRRGRRRYIDTDKHGRSDRGDSDGTSPTDTKPVGSSLPPPLFPAIDAILGPQVEESQGGVGYFRFHARDNPLAFIENLDPVHLMPLSKEEIDQLLEKSDEGQGKRQSLHQLTSDPVLDSSILEGGTAFWDANADRMEGIVKRVKEKDAARSASTGLVEANILKKYQDDWMKLQGACLKARKAKRKAQAGRWGISQVKTPQPMPDWDEPTQLNKSPVKINMDDFTFTYSAPEGIFAPPPTSLQHFNVVSERRIGWKKRDAGESGRIELVIPRCLHSDNHPSDLPRHFKIPPQEVARPQRPSLHPAFRSFEDGQKTLKPTPPFVAQTEGCIRRSATERRASQTVGQPDAAQEKMVKQAAGQRKVAPMGLFQVTRHIVPRREVRSSKGTDHEGRREINPNAAAQAILASKLMQQRQRRQRAEKLLHRPPPALEPSIRPVLPTPPAIQLEVAAVAPTAPALPVSPVSPGPKASLQAALPMTPSRTPPTRVQTQLYRTPDQAVTPYPVLRKWRACPLGRPLRSSPHAVPTLRSSPLAAPRSARKTLTAVPYETSPHQLVQYSFPLDPRLHDQDTIDMLASMANKFGETQRKLCESRQ